MGENTIGDSEYKLMELIWEYAPIASGELSNMCEMIHGCEQRQQQQREELVTTNFKGSLPMFVNAFLGNGKKMSKEDAARLIDMIEEHTEE